MAVLSKEALFLGDTLVISVSRKERPSDVFLRRLMAGLGVFFLLQGIAFSTGFMLPCFLCVIGYYVYRRASKREYEYTLSDGLFRIERVSDSGRTVYHEIPFSDIVLLCEPGAPEALPYKRGGSVRVKKYDYTSYKEGVPYYTMIVRDDRGPLKFLLDLTPEAIRMIRLENREAVKIPPEALAGPRH